ncbi:MBL fold metallo-hydrolase [Pseudactinotalea suaedae]|uniref:MBL fold metallo-hydrolase n=1 Tax=Pseudactinotalea suaedae TaxID=1524924 RepID=UPI0012E183B9|nr:MBL fold metallo-hydrolase [Pseudactinotalea suaedae]
MTAVEVADGVLVTTSAIDVTTSTVVVRGSEALLVDPAWTLGELDVLADLLVERGLVATAGFSTHAHHDHLLWHPRLGKVPRWASPRTAELAAGEPSALLAQMGPGWPADVLELLGRVTTADGDRLPEPWGEAELVVHDGHAPGHTAVWLPERGVLLAGDMLSDVELPLPFGPDDLPSYLAGLEVLAPYVARAAVLVPGHGTPTTAPLARLDADRRYLDDVLTRGDSDDPRIGHLGMAEHHAHLQRLMRAGS